MLTILHVLKRFMTQSLSGSQMEGAILIKRKPMIFFSLLLYHGEYIEDFKSKADYFANVKLYTCSTLVVVLSWN